MVFDLSTSSRLQTIERPQENAAADHIEWAADSKSLFVAGANKARIGNIWRIPLDGGTPVRLTNYSRDQIFDFDLSPDRNRIALTRGNWIGDIVLIDLTN